MTIQINTESNSPDSSKNSRMPVVIGVTILLHLVAIALAFMYFPDWRSGESGSNAEQAAIDATSTDSNDTSSNDAEATAAIPAESKPKNFDESVEKRVLDLVDKAESRDDSENRTVLEEKAAELTNISSSESIEKMAPILTNALKLKPRATTPAEVPPEGPFDPTSAQFYDVRRETTESGEVRYVSVMLDAEGRTIELELNEAEGESIYQTMKLVKENPLLEKVYRELVIPAMDKATRAEE